MSKNYFSFTQFFNNANEGECYQINEKSRRQCCYKGHCTIPPLRKQKNTVVNNPSVFLGIFFFFLWSKNFLVKKLFLVKKIFFVVKKKQVKKNLLVIFFCHGRTRARSHAHARIRTHACTQEHTHASFHFPQTRPFQLYYLPNQNSWTSSIEMVFFLLKMHVIQLGILWPIFP